ncbi:MAG: hypothetical protein Q9214_000726 [Letrouitia sp. 1 TL-2023]
MAGIMVSHVAHALSVLVLYDLSYLLHGASAPKRSSRFAMLSAGLHILSPAGIFLSTAYAESTFAFLNFCGMYLYAISVEKHREQRFASRDFTLVASSLSFGFAISLRSNGLLNGAIFGYDAISTISQEIHLENIGGLLRRIFFVSIAGCLTALGALIPQYLAYYEYCYHDQVFNKRPWCGHTVPSIYGWVQDHYWGVGFLRYWTLSNFPLFLLAIPMLLILLSSGLWATRPRLAIFDRINSLSSTDQSSIGLLDGEIVRRLAVPQILLAALALTFYHVQIINRISSAYPVWYWWIASQMIEKQGFWGMKALHSTDCITRCMLIYALVQGGLFSGFLPPA